MSPSNTRFHSDRMHPDVYYTVIGLAAWSVAAAWAFFSGGPYTSLVLAVVTGFVVMAVGLPLILSRVGRSGERRRPVRYHDWAAGEFELWQSRLDGREAATQVVLPIAAAAVGMTLIGLVFYFTTPPGV
ncbi:MAG: hypothetical protein OJF62_003664 [Pseudolabrys sp.]|nr:hypothetical protein [Pseudolabrys sp.]